MNSRPIIAALVIAGLGVAAYKSGLVATLMTAPTGTAATAVPVPAPAPPADGAQAAPAVSVVAAVPADFIETVLVTGSLVPREEILVAPEVEGLRVLELKVDEGDRVKKGDVLAILVSEQLDAQLAQNDAALGRSEAAIGQAKSQIAEADAKLAEAKASLDRAAPLVKSKFLSESVFDQRQAASKSAEAQLAAARSGLALAEAERTQVEAQRRELAWRRGNTDVRSPSDGIVSRRSARVGSIAVGGFVAGAGEPLFRIIAKGEIELDAEVSEKHLAKVAAGQTAKIEVAGSGTFEGTVRLVSPEVDKATRLGRVRIFLGDKPGLRIGGFARGLIETGKAHNIAVPQSAILYGSLGEASVQVVAGGKVETRRIETGLSSGGQVEVRSGLSAGELLVAKAGTFLRDGDAVRPVLPQAAVNEATR